MGYQTIFQRQEVKFLLTKQQQENILLAMEDYMKADAFGASTISNIYFDTPDYRLIRRSLEKPVYKEKFRIRSYGVAKPQSTVFMELKKKYKSVVYKRRISLTEEEAMNYMVYDKPLTKDTQIAREIDYFRHFYGRLVPAVYLSYERQAYYAKNDGDFRITFDKNILWRDCNVSLRHGAYGKAILETGQVLMEIKAAGGIPLWMTDILSDNKVYKTSFSKYGHAYEDILINKQTNGGILYA